MTSRFWAARTCARFLAVVLALLAGACASAGRNFERPDPSSLVLGSMTKSEAIARFGTPAGQTSISSGSGATNSSQDRLPPGLRRAEVPGLVESIRYTYAHAAFEGSGAISRVRLLSLSFWNDRLVRYNFSSSFENDGTNFDENKVSSFVRGQTTRAQVESALGHPGGESVYPLVAKQGTRALTYEYVIVGPKRGQATLKSVSLLFDSSDRLLETYVFSEIRDGARIGS